MRLADKLVICGAVLAVVGAGAYRGIYRREGHVGKEAQKSIKYTAVRKDRRFYSPSAGKLHTIQEKAERGIIMCGIAGQIGYEQDMRKMSAVMTKLSAVLAPRGPDASGVYIDESAFLSSSEAYSH